MLSHVNVVIQATSLGLRQNDPSPLNPELMKPEICMFDTVYKKTQFLKAAEAAGCRTSSGESMLVYQGAKSFEIWTGIKPPADIMKKAVGINA
jgi:shikimate dehydrogenase